MGPPVARSSLGRNPSVVVGLVVLLPACVAGEDSPLVAAGPPRALGAISFSSSEVQLAPLADVEQPLAWRGSPVIASGGGVHLLTWMAEASQNPSGPRPLLTTRFRASDNS